MARTQAKILTSTWSDPDFVALPSDAQRLYWLLLSQPKLTLAGCLDLMPQRWANLAPDTDLDDVRAALALLVGGRFVVVDADELVLRTFVKTDLGPKANGNLVKGMWGAWRAIMSPLLRKVVVDAMPAPVYERCPEDVPDEARSFRAEPPIDLPLERPSERALERPSEPASERATEPSVALDLSLLPAACSTTKPQDNTQPDEQTIRRAVVLVARRIAGDRDDGGAYAAGIQKRILLDPIAGADDLARITTELTEGRTPEAIAAAWVPADPLAGLFPERDRPVPERHGPAMPEFRAQHEDQTMPPEQQATNLSGIAAARAASKAAR